MESTSPGPSTRREAAVETGLFGESLFVSFNFTKDSMLAAGERYLEALRSQPVADMPSEIKTYVHELTHYLHYTTTPYGLFLQFCRVMQSRATIVIVQALLAAGVRFDIPLLYNVPDLSGDTADTFRNYLTLWLNVENLVATLSADSQLRAELMEAYNGGADTARAGQRFRLPPLLDLRTAFFRVQESMADLLEQINADARAAGNTVPMEPVGFDREALRQEMESFPSDQDWGDLRTHDALDLLGNPINVGAIIESAATAAECWGSGTSYEAFTAWANTPVDPELQVYRVCLAQALNAIPTRALPEFVMSYMALCELALYAPLLPHHAALRREKPDFRQILPVHRWMELIGAAGKAAPMRGTSDCARYVTDICRALGWVHPIQIIKLAIDGPDRFTNPLAQIYVWAQQWRAKSMGAFLGVQRYLFDSSPIGATWREQFNFMVLDYADCTNYHHDKGFLQAMTTRRLNMLGMRCIMMNRKKLTIAAPYRGNAAERQWMTEWLRNRFKSVFGRDFPGLRFV